MNKLERLIDDNIGLIHNVANKYRSVIYYTSFEYEDLLQEAIIAFIKCYKKYDKNNGSKFTTYATKAMNNEIINSIRKNSNQIKFPEYYGYIWKIANENEEMDINDISKATNISKDKVENAIYWNKNKHLKSMNEIVKNSKDEDVQELGNLIESHSDFSNVYVIEFLNKLDNRKREIVELRMEGCTCQEIGDQFGLSRKRISAILKEVANKYKLTN